MKRNHIVQRDDVRFNFLRYHRLIMKWARVNSGLGHANIELLIQLYHRELGWFTKAEYRIATLVHVWRAARWQMFLDEGWIERTNHMKRTKDNMRYDLSLKAKILVATILDMNAGVKDIPEGNEIMNKKTYSHKLWEKAIKEFNRDKTRKQ